MAENLPKLMSDTKSNYYIEDFHTPLSVVGRSNRKSQKNICTSNHLDLTSIDYFIQQNKYNFFSKSHRTFTNIDHMLGSKTA